MGLSLSLGNALSGLRSAQTGLDTVSRNIASAGTEGYARRTVSAVEGTPSGVRDGAVQRVIDSVVQRQLRRESAGGAYTATVATGLQRLDESFGAPGGVGSLDTLFNTFTSKLQTLASEPGNANARAGVVGAAQVLAGALNSLSADVQGLGGDAEARIAGAADEANAALETIDRIESNLATAGDGNARADLLDERDRQLDRLSSLMDIRVSDRGDGRIAITTANGASLYDGQAAHLEFTPRGTIGPRSLANADPALSGVGQLRIVDARGGTIDLTANNLRSGEMAGLLTLRDETLVRAQDRLDGMAAGIASATSETTVPGQISAVPLFMDVGDGVAAQPFTGVGGPVPQQRGFAARIALNPAIAADASKLVLADGVTRPGDNTRPQAMLAALTTTSRTLSVGSKSFTGTPADLVRQSLDAQGAEAGDAISLDDGQQVVVASLKERFSESSGVSVDQELANLVELQSAYSANARIITAVREMLDVLMRI